MITQWRLHLTHCRPIRNAKMWLDFLLMSFTAARWLVPSPASQTHIGAMDRAMHLFPPPASKCLWFMVCYWAMMRYLRRASLWTRWGTLQHTLSTGEQIVLWHKNSCTRDSGIPNVFEMLLNQKRTCNIALATLQREIIQQRGKGMIGSNGKHIKIWSRRDCGRSRGMKEIEKHLTVVMRDKKRSCSPFQQMKEETAVKIK